MEVGAFDGIIGSEVVAFNIARVSKCDIRNLLIGSALQKASDKTVRLQVEVIAVQISAMCRVFMECCIAVGEIILVIWKKNGQKNGQKKT